MRTFQKRIDEYESVFLLSSLGAFLVGFFSFLLLPLLDLSRGGEEITIMSVSAIIGASFCPLVFGNKALPQRLFVANGVGVGLMLALLIPLRFHEVIGPFGLWVHGAASIGIFALGAWLLWRDVPAMEAALGEVIKRRATQMIYDVCGETTANQSPMNHEPSGPVDWLVFVVPTWRMVLAAVLVFVVPNVGSVPSSVLGALVVLIFGIIEVGALLLIWGVLKREASRRARHAYETFSKGLRPRVVDPQVA